MVAVVSAKFCFSLRTNGFSVFTQVFSLKSKICHVLYLTKVSPTFPMLAINTRPKNNKWVKENQKIDMNLKVFYLFNVDICILVYNTNTFIWVDVYTNNFSRVTLLLHEYAILVLCPLQFFMIVIDHSHLNKALTIFLDKDTEGGHVQKWCNSAIPPPKFGNSTMVVHVAHIFNSLLVRHTFAVLFTAFHKS